MLGGHPSAERALARTPAYAAESPSEPSLSQDRALRGSHRALEVQSQRHTQTDRQLLRTP